MVSLLRYVGSNAVPEQQSCTIDWNTQSTPDSGRDMSGLNHNEFVAPKFKILVVWPPQTLAVRAALMMAIKTQPNLSNFTCTFLNPDTGEEDATHYFMIGTPISNKLLEDRTEGDMWDAVEVHFIEN